MARLGGSRRHERGLAKLGISAFHVLVRAACPIVFGGVEPVLDGVFDGVGFVL